MGNSAEPQGDETEDTTTEAIEPTEPGKEPVDGEDGEDETVEVEVVRQGADGSQPAKQRGFQKRVNKLNLRVDHAKDDTARANAELAAEREKNKVMALALEQSRQNQPADAMPDPVDFDDGTADPKYRAALQKQNQQIIAAEVRKQTAALTATQKTAQIDPDLQRRQREHYAAAQDMKARDYEEVEDRAIDILGKDTVNHLIQNSDKAHVVLYYLGKNPDEAENIKNLIDTNPISATLQLGRLEAELTIRPKANSGSTADPDTELQGGTPSAGKTSRHQKKVDAARAKAQTGGNMKAVLDAKKEARDAGVTVI